MFARIGESLHSGVMFIGLKDDKIVALSDFLTQLQSYLGGLFGSTLGLFVGIGFGRGHILPLIWTQIEGGNSSPCSAEGSNGQNLS